MVSRGYNELAAKSLLIKTLTKKSPLRYHSKEKFIQSLSNAASQAKNKNLQLNYKNILNIMELNLNTLKRYVKIYKVDLSNYGILKGNKSNKDIATKEEFIKILTNIIFQLKEEKLVISLKNISIKMKISTAKLTSYLKKFQIPFIIQQLKDKIERGVLIPNRINNIAISL